MIPGGGEWTATLTVRSTGPEFAGWLEQALRPEASREVPRARAEIRRTEGGVVEVAIVARDVGALRAALNTYLGWIHLSVATVRAARPELSSESPEP